MHFRILPLKTWSMKYSKQNIKRRIFTQSHLKGDLFPDSFLEVCLLTLAHKCLFQENNSDLGQRRFKERTQIKDFLEQGDIVSLGYLARNTGQVFRRVLLLFYPGPLSSPAAEHPWEEADRPACVCSVLRKTLISFIKDAGFPKCQRHSFCVKQTSRRQQRMQGTGTWNLTHRHCWEPAARARDCIADQGTASHLCGGLIFAPAPSPGPTSCSSNGCQVESGPDRIELSAPCCVLIYCFRHFHIGFIFTHSTAAAQSSQSLPGRVAPECGYLAPGNGFLHSRAQVRPSESAAARPELGIGCHPSNMPRCDTDARTGPFSQQERKL